MSANRPRREAERRFLLRQQPELPCERVLRLRQFYTQCDKTRHYTARFRLAEDVRTGEVTCIETHKIGSGFDILETEYPIDPHLYPDLQRLYGIGREIEKIRYVAACNGETWEIDVYSGCFPGLVVAEIEMDDPHRAFVVPECFGPSEEVTFWRGMKNASLCVFGLSDELKARLRAWYGREVWTAAATGEIRQEPGLS